MHIPERSMHDYSIRHVSKAMRHILDGTVLHKAQFNVINMQ